MKVLQLNEQSSGLEYFDQRGQFRVIRQINHLSILGCAVTMHNTINKRNLSLTLRSLIRYIPLLLWIAQSAKVYCIDDILLSISIKIITMEEEHGILTKNGWMFSLPHSHFQFKSINISNILASKLKLCVYVWKLVSWLSLGIYFSGVETSVNKEICLNCVFFLHRVMDEIMYEGQLELRSSPHTMPRWRLFPVLYFKISMLLKSNSTINT